jgi:formylglycine-generating enzyme required for sulfatase activity
MTNKPHAVFLSYNGEDREAVEEIAVYLADKANLHPWFDQWELIPGEPWVRNLERGLANSSACAVFVGKSGQGPWQTPEVEAALREQVRNPGFRVIPVLLPEAPQQPKLPPFLAGNTWVDMRVGLDDDKALWRLECGIQGISPGRGRPRQATEQSVTSLLGPGPQPPPVSPVPSASVLKPPSPLDIIWVPIPGMAEVRASGCYPGFTGFKLGDGLKSDQEYHEENETWPEDAPAIEIAPFWLAAYPMTVAQFRPFVEGDGYKNPKYWTEDRWNWRKKDDRRTPESWEDPEWHVDDHPVIDVTWYEAVAYCCWLTRRMAESGQPGWMVRLPTEAEWEWAARGPEAHRWPWGNKWKAGRCNTGESGIKRTSAVRSFLQGANWTRDFPESGQGQAVYDLAGNVWEWCSTCWRENYPLPVLESEWTKDYLAGEASRSLRRGSWFNDLSGARVAFRDWYHPDNGDDNIGFRCCVATSF